MQFKVALIILAALLLIVQAAGIDFSDLSWSNNSGSYLSMLAMALLILSMALSIREEKKQKAKES